MINEIKKLRRRGLSFRKIAKELDTTVGKVQYQWVKFVKQTTDQANDELDENNSRNTVETSVMPDVQQVSKVMEDTLHFSLISDDTVFVFWKLSLQKKNIVASYFDKPFTSWLNALRIYDVTNIIFNGSNAHSYHEVILGDKHTDWTFKGLKGNRSYCIEFGIKLSESKFFPLFRSNAFYSQGTSSMQADELEKMKQYLQKGNYPPNWTEHVSTYSYYENINEGENENDRFTGSIHTCKKAGS